jgi:hypothetical protein
LWWVINPVCLLKKDNKGGDAQGANKSPLGLSRVFLRNADRVEGREVQFMELKVPQTLRFEHIELREQLYALTKEDNDLGAAARAVMELFYMHATKEEERVLPALEALPQLAEGKIPDSMTSLKEIAADLKGGLYEELHEDHRALLLALSKISDIALILGRNDQVKFVERFNLHAQMEEEILYPAARVAAEYCQLLMQCRENGG